MLIKHSLKNLTQEVSLMARRSQAILTSAIAVIDSRDETAIEEVRGMDKLIDEYEIKIDNLCMSLLLKDPYAVDFRYIFSISKAIRDLERVGDQSKTIAKWSRKLQKEVDSDMGLLADKAKEALDLSVQALLQGDVEAAEQVMKLEFQVDELEDKIIESADSIAEAFIAKALERVGDLATNIAEDVIFYVQARDIRHGGYEES